MAYMTNTTGSDFSMEMARAVFSNVPWLQEPHVDHQTNSVPSTQPGAEPYHAPTDFNASQAGSRMSARQSYPTSQQRVNSENPYTQPPDMPTMAGETKEWLGNSGISQETIGKLERHGFINKQVISAMLEHDMDMLQIQPLGQKRLLQQVASNLRPANIAAAVQSRSTETPQDSHDITGQIADLLRALPMESAGRQPHTTGERVDLNPLAYLLPRKVQRHLDITEFVRVGPTEHEESISEGGDGSQIVLKSGPKRPRLENVTPMQWSAANLRILIELLQEGHLQAQNIFEYLAYTIKISELAESYVWQSVLCYDRAYRQLQAQHGFKWGSDSQHLGIVHLRARQSAPPSRPQKMYVTSGSRAKAEGEKAQLCRLYNRLQCPFGASCKYRHVCSATLCGQAHPLATHRKSQDPESKNAQAQA